MPFVESESSLPYSQEPATAPHFQPDESDLQSKVIFLQYPSEYYPAIYV
jgi:hypothetical protein